METEQVKKWFADKIVRFINTASVQRWLREPLHRLRITAVSSFVTPLFVVEIAYRVIFFGLLADVTLHAFSIWLMVFGVLVIALGILSCLPNIALSVFAAFQRLPKKQLLIQVVCSYLVIIMCFASLYYFLLAAGDAFEGAKNIQHFLLQRERLARLEIDGIQPPDSIRNLRAFNGVDRSVWIMPSEQTWIAVFEKEPTLPAEGVVQKHDLFRYDSFGYGAIFVDCFHYSVVSMTTVGYGDITPRTWYAKLFTDSQLLIGQFLFVVAIGMAFGNWWEEPPTPSTAVK